MNSIAISLLANTWMLIISTLFPASFVRGDTVVGCPVNGDNVNVNCNNISNAPVVNKNGNSATNGTGLSDRIALGVGIGIGIPAFIIACVGVYYAYRMWKTTQSEESNLSGMQVEMTELQATQREQDPSDEPIHRRQ
jgi:hypothetical protein